MASDYKQYIDSSDFYKISLDDYELVDINSYKITTKANPQVSERSPFILANDGRYYGSIGFYYGDDDEEILIKDGQITTYKFSTYRPKAKWPDIEIYLCKYRFKNRKSMWHKENLTDVTVDMMEDKYKRSSLREGTYMYDILRNISIPLSGSFRVEVEFSEKNKNKVTEYEMNLFDH